MILDDEKYKSLRNSLKSLPRVKAKSGFDTRLMQRIKEAEKGVIHTQPEAIKEPIVKNWFANLFRPSFAPAMALTVVLLITVVVYFAYFSKLGDKNSEITQVGKDEKQGELVIYVRKDTESSFSENYPKEYSAITSDGTDRERISAPTEMPSDYLSRPDAPKQPGFFEIDKPDRVSEEQKLEMQRTVDSDGKGVDTKGETRSEDEVMKKESKGDIRKESKGEMKSETKESPFNIRDDKKNENINKDGDEVNQEVSPSLKADEKINDSMDNEKVKQDSIDLGKSVKDSLKTRTSKTEAEQKEDSTDKK